MLKDFLKFPYHFVVVFWLSTSAQANISLVQLEQELVQQLNIDSSAVLERADLLLGQKQYEFEANREAWFLLTEIKAHAQINLGQFEQAKSIADKLYTLHSAQAYPVYRARAALILAMYGERQNSVVTVKRFALEGLSLLEKRFEHDDLKADLYAVLSTAYRHEANFSQALSYSQKALALSNLNKSKQAVIYNQIGVIYDYMGNLQLALEYHEKSLQIRRKNANQQGLSDSLYNIGEIYRDMGQLDSALSHFKQALQVDESLGNPYHIANSQGKLGQVYLAMGQLELAKSHIEQGLALTLKMDAPSDTAWQLSNMARVHMAQDKLKPALDVANRALTLALKANAKRTEHTVRMTLLDIALAEKNEKLAREQIGVLLQMDNIGLLYQKELHEINATLYEDNGQWQQAYHELKKYIDTQQKLYSDLETTSTEKLKQNVEVVRQEQELNLLKKEQALQKAKLENLELQRTVIVLIGLLLAGGLLLIYLKHKQTRRIAFMEARMLAANLEEKNQLLADVSHELRTPLAALKLSIELLEHNIEPDVDKAYGKVHSKIAQLDNLIGDIYRSAQYDNNAMQLVKCECDLGELLFDVVHDFIPQFDSKPQELVVEPILGKVTCHVDPERFKQIVVNLLNNSLAYTNVNGKTVVSLEVVEQQKVKLTICDSTPGLADKELEKIFERLYRVEASRSRDLGGSGLGLAICKQIVLAHGGTIEAHHSHLGGVSFVVLLDAVSSN